MKNPFKKKVIESPVELQPYWQLEILLRDRQYTSKDVWGEIPPVFQKFIDWYQFDMINGYYVLAHKDARIGFHKKDITSIFLTKNMLNQIRQQWRIFFLLLTDRWSCGKIFISTNKENP